MAAVKIKKRNIVVRHERGWQDYFFTVLVFCLALTLITAVYYYFISPKVIYREISPSFVSHDNSTLVSMQIPAVTDKNEGVSTTLVVEAMPGTGRILLDINNLLFWADTEQSIRKARLVAANVTGKDIEKYDLFYNIDANASLIGGESAGAALTIATIAALENKSFDKSIMITGTINHDGTIGPVAGILEKAKASKSVGATIFLVPLLQSRDVVYEVKEHCEKFGVTEICSTEQIPQKLKVSDSVNITIYEVDSIDEAMDYFFKE